MSNTTPALQLRKIPYFLQLLFRLFRHSKPISPQLFDSSIKTDKSVSAPLGFSSTKSIIEREIENGLYDYYKASHHQAISLQKLFKNPKKWIAFTSEDQGISAVTVTELYQQLEKKLLNQDKGLELMLTPQEFAAIRPTIARIMYFHGNQALTSAPYFAGGIPQFVYFQWGNFLGVAKYASIGGERSSKGNVLVYFEELRERTLEECVLKHQNEQAQLVKEINAPKLVLPGIMVPQDSVIAPAPSVTVPTLSLRLTPSAADLERTAA